MQEQKLLKLVDSVIGHLKYQGQPLKLYNYQKRILYALLNPNVKRICLSCCTQIGKSFVVALGVIIYALLHPGNKCIIIAPTYNQSRIIFDYLKEFIVENPIFYNMIDLKKKIDDVKRLTNEISKERITFTNGSVVTILSASGKGERILGHSADLVILDESPLISDEVYYKYILRMLAKSKNSKLLEIGNPVVRNHFYEATRNPDYLFYKIDYKVALEEGKFTPEFIEEMKRRYPPHYFKVMFEAEFPEEGERAFFSNSEIQTLTEDIDYNKYINFAYEKIIAVDIARYGKDKTCLICARRYYWDTEEGDEESFFVIDKIVLWDKTDLMTTANKIAYYYKDYTADHVIVDAIGLGAGVYDRLVELDIPTTPFVASERPRSDKFANKKSECMYRLKELLANKRICLLDKEHLKELIQQLSNEEMKITEAGKLKAIDPSDKSPDILDALTILTSADMMERYYVGPAIDL